MTDWSPRVSGLAEELRRARESKADAPADERREEIRAHLEKALGEVSDNGERADLLRELREFFIAEAREREQRLSELASENQVLKARLKSMGGRAPAAGGAPAAAAGGGGDAIAVLVELLQGKNVRSRIQELPAATRPLAVTLSELVNFVETFSLAVTQFQQATGSTQMTKNTIQLREQANAALKIIQEGIDTNPDDLPDRIRRELTQLARFPLILYEAHLRSVPESYRALLKEFDPEPLEKKNRKKLLGREVLDRENLWLDFRGIFERLKVLQEEEFRRKFFDRPFEKALKNALKPGTKS